MWRDIGTPRRSSAGDRMTFKTIEKVQELIILGGLCSRLWSPAANVTGGGTEVPRFYERPQQGGIAATAQLLPAVNSVSPRLAACYDRSTRRMALIPGASYMKFEYELGLCQTGGRVSMGPPCGNRAGATFSSARPLLVSNRMAPRNERSRTTGRRQKHPRGLFGVTTKVVRRCPESVNITGRCVFYGAISGRIMRLRRHL
jgi:hypothetical protein